jgi:branched-chain amino acid transport system substrate-binding protein
MTSITRRSFIGRTAAAATMLPGVASAQGKGKYDDGASDTEIKIGNTNPYSGPASSYGMIGKAIDAYWKMVNDQGGINGRKIRFISLDDGYSPPKTVELTRQLVEQEKVLLLFSPLGTPTIAAIHKYVNRKKVPTLFVASGATKWGNPKEFPWTMGWQPPLHTEGAIFARHLLATVKDPKIAVLMQNDDYGKDFYEGVRDGLGKDAGKIVRHVTYEVTDPTVDSQIIQLKDSGANALINIATPKFAAQAIRKAADIDWKPVHYLNSSSNSVVATMKPAGFENGQGIISAAYVKDPTDKQWDDAHDMKAWRAWMAKYNPGANIADVLGVMGYALGYTMQKTLEQCGNELTRDNVMKQAANLKNLVVPMLLPGITISTSPADFFPIQSERLQRFKGESWELFGEVISSESA